MKLFDLYRLRDATPLHLKSGISIQPGEPVLGISRNVRHEDWEPYLVILEYNGRRFSLNEEFLMERFVPITDIPVCDCCHRPLSWSRA